MRVLGRGTDHVRSVCATGDGRHVVTADGDGALRVWDLLTGTCTQTLTGHTGVIYSVSATADDRHVLSVGDDGTVRVWDCRPTTSTGSPAVSFRSALVLGYSCTPESCPGLVPPSEPIPCLRRPHAPSPTRTPFLFSDASD